MARALGTLLCVLGSLFWVVALGGAAVLIVAGFRDDDFSYMVATPVVLAVGAGLAFWGTIMLIFGTIICLLKDIEENTRPRTLPAHIAAQSDLDWAA